MQKQVNIKDASIEVIKNLPDSCSIDDIMYQINFVSQVLEGTKDIDNGKVTTTSDLLKEIADWKTK